MKKAPRKLSSTDPVIELHDVETESGTTALEWRGRLSAMLKQNPGVFSKRDLAEIRKLEAGQGKFFDYGAGGVWLIRKPTKQS